MLRVALGSLVTITLLLFGCMYIVASHYSNRIIAARGILHPGTTRSKIIEELGQPASTQTDHGKTIDTFLVPASNWQQVDLAEATGNDPRVFFFFELFDPLVTPAFLFVGRDANKCEYQVTYDDTGNTESIKCHYPKGFTENDCFGDCPTPRE